MKKKSILIIALFASSTYISMKAEEKKEPSFKERQWEKKKLKATERIDQAITATLVAAVGNQATQQCFFNPFPVNIKKHSPKITGAAAVAKLAITLRRMHLLDQYVGWNPFKMIPSMLYFVVVDMASWRWK
jgi:hypothetical protein